MGPGHPVEGLKVNCPPLGPWGHLSSPGEDLTFQSSFAVYKLQSTTVTALAGHSGNK